MRRLYLERSKNIYLDSYETFWLNVNSCVMMSSTADWFLLNLLKDLQKLDLNLTDSAAESRNQCCVNLLLSFTPLEVLTLLALYIPAQ